MAMNHRLFYKKRKTVAPRHFLSCILLTPFALCGMYSSLKDRENAKAEAEYSIKQTIVARLMTSHEIATYKTVHQSLSLCGMDPNQHPLIDNIATYTADHEVNRHINNSRHQYNPHTQSPCDWYNGLPSKVKKKLAKKLCFDKSTIKVAFPKKRLFFNKEK